MSRIAVMQPYIFPYLGYFQLINAVDTFVFLNDVNFIKRGWINRNQIWQSGPLMFTIPLENASQNRRINEHKVVARELWLPKLLSQIEHAYKKAPFFEPVMRLIHDVFDSPYMSIDDLASKSVREVSNYLAIGTTFLRSSDLGPKNQHGEERIIAIAEHLCATDYINPIGGLELYNGTSFSHKNLTLRFLRQLPLKNSGFPAERQIMSIIDLLMLHSIDELKNALLDFELIEPR